MKYININIRFLPVMISFILLFSCTKQSENNMSGNNLKGTLKGKISIGPLCPVETTPPLPQCQPTEATYKAWAVAIWTGDKKLEKVAVLSPQLDGNYRLDIPAGVYVINFDTADNIFMGTSNLPYSVTIEAEKTSVFYINIDTGIR